MIISSKENLVILEIEKSDVDPDTDLNEVTEQLANGLETIKPMLSMQIKDASK